VTAAFRTSADSASNFPTSALPCLLRVARQLLPSLPPFRAVICPTSPLPLPPTSHLTASALGAEWVSLPVFGCKHPFCDLLDYRQAQPGSKVPGCRPTPAWPIACLGPIRRKHCSRRVALLSHADFRILSYRPRGTHMMIPLLLYSCPLLSPLGRRRVLRRAPPNSRRLSSRLEENVTQTRFANARQSQPPSMYWTSLLLVCR
jgi:hypothetical protein